MSEEDITLEHLEQEEKTTEKVENEKETAIINELLSSYEANDLEESFEKEETKNNTELARRMLQKNLERLLLNQSSCKDVISQLTGTMTSSQVQKLVEKTNLELNKSEPQASILKNNCSECESRVKMRSYWTPQTHRKKRVSSKHNRSEMVQSMVFSQQKKRQYYSPQLQRRQSESKYEEFYLSCSEESSEDEIEAEQKFQKTKQKLQYYGGVHPVYLPNSRVKAKQKKQELAQHCQGCCHHPNNNERRMKSDDKRCIIS